MFVSSGFGDRPTVLIGLAPDEVGRMALSGPGREALSVRLETVDPRFPELTVLVTVGSAEVLRDMILRLNPGVWDLTGIPDTDRPATDRPDVDRPATDPPGGAG